MRRIHTWKSSSSGKPAAGKVDLDRPVAENLKIIAKSLNLDVDDLTVVILDRPRHAELIAQVRAAGARIKLIEDGDLMAAISVAVAGTAVHASWGSAARPKGVLAAAALKCLGAEILGRSSPQQRATRARQEDGRFRRRRPRLPHATASGKDVALRRDRRDDGDLLQGVRFFAGGARTHSC